MKMTGWITERHWFGEIRVSEHSPQDETPRYRGTATINYYKNDDPIEIGSGPHETADKARLAIMEKVYELAQKIISDLHEPIRQAKKKDFVWIKIGKPEAK